MQQPRTARGSVRDGGGHFLGGDAGGKAAIGRFHIPVPVVDADDFCVVDRFHNKSFPAHSAFQNISDNSFSGGYPLIPFCRKISVYSSFSAGNTAFKKQLQ